MVMRVDLGQGRLRSGGVWDEGATRMGMDAYR